MTMNPTELKGALEAIIYAADEPATLEQISKAVCEEKTTVNAALDEMIAAYATEDRGMEIRGVAGGYKFYTKPQHHEVVRRFIKSLRPPLRLTMPALETLAVIAYRQPVTGPEIQEIRGVNVSGVIKTLLDKRLIVTAGRKAVMGRPIMYRSSKEFLMRFGLSDLEELPSLKEFEQLARAALGSDEGIAPIEPEEQESMNGAGVMASVPAEVNGHFASNKTRDSIDTVDIGELNDTVEAVTVNKPTEVAATVEATPAVPTETPEAPQSDSEQSEHSEQAKAESAS
jgi:segregation and condensation protein B